MYVGFTTQPCKKINLRIKLKFGFLLHYKINYTIAIFDAFYSRISNKNHERKKEIYQVLRNKVELLHILRHKSRKIRLITQLHIDERNRRILFNTKLLSGRYQHPCC